MSALTSQEINAMSPWEIKSILKGLGVVWVDDDRQTLERLLHEYSGTITYDGIVEKLKSDGVGILSDFTSERLNKILKRALSGLPINREVLYDISRELNRREYGELGCKERLNYTTLRDMDLSGLTKSDIESMSIEDIKSALKNLMVINRSSRKEILQELLYKYKDTSENRVLVERIKSEGIEILSSLKSKRIFYLLCCFPGGVKHGSRKTMLERIRKGLDSGEVLNFF